MLDRRARDARDHRQRDVLRRVTIDRAAALGQFLFLFAVVNLFLGLFNLLPIPPLDGSAILERALPAKCLETWYRFRPYGILVLFLLVFSTDLGEPAVQPVPRTVARLHQRLVNATRPRSVPSRRALLHVAVRGGRRATRRSQRSRAILTPRRARALAVDVARGSRRVGRDAGSAAARRPRPTPPGPPPRSCTTWARPRSGLGTVGRVVRHRRGAGRRPRRGSGAGPAPTSATPRSGPRRCSRRAPGPKSSPGPAPTTIPNAGPPG